MKCYACVLMSAIKFTPNNGKIDIRLERPDSHVRLIVKDTGIGIAPDSLTYSFERFRQVDSSNVRSHGGLGLGLAIVDYLVRQQDGKVRAESEGLGTGATLTVESPLTSFELAGNKLQSNKFLSQAALTELSSAGDYKLKNRRILIVEDDSDTQALLRTMLERHGADVVTVNSGAAGLTEVERHKPDVIISDIGMTSENGYEFIKRIRSLPRDDGGHIPAIALTAYAAPSDRRKALLAGFQTHLAKPIEPADLLALILSLTFQQEDFS